MKGSRQENGSKEAKMSAHVLWMNIPLMIIAFGLWVGVPLYLVLRHPERHPKENRAMPAYLGRSSERRVSSGRLRSGSAPTTVTTAWCRGNRREMGEGHANRCPLCGKIVQGHLRRFAATGIARRGTAGRFPCSRKLFLSRRFFVRIEPGPFIFGRRSAARSAAMFVAMTQPLRPARSWTGGSDTGQTLLGCPVTARDVTSF